MRSIAQKFILVSSLVLSVPMFANQCSFCTNTPDMQARFKANFTYCQAVQYTTGHTDAQGVFTGCEWQMSCQGHFSPAYKQVIDPRLPESPINPMTEVVGSRINCP